MYIIVTIKLCDINFLQTDLDVIVFTDKPRRNDEKKCIKVLPKKYVSLKNGRQRELALRLSM